MKWSWLRNRFINQEAFVSHVNAVLTPRTRLRLARLVVESGWTYAAAAKMFMVSAKRPRSRLIVTVRRVPPRCLPGLRHHAQTHPPYRPPPL